MSEVLLASKSLFHVDTNQRSLYSIYILQHYTKLSQGITVAAYPEQRVGNDPEPLGVAFLQGPSFTLMISLTLSNSSCLTLRLEILLN